MNQRNQLIIFIAVTFSLSILLSLFVGLTGGHESKFIWLQVTTMPIPAFAVLVMSNIFKAPLYEPGWNQFPVRWLPLALFIMPLSIHIVCIPLMSFLNAGSLPWQSWLIAKNGELYYAPNNLGWGTLTSAALVSRILLNAVTGVILVSLLAFLEEIGWRAWMLPRLIEQFDVKKGMFIGALIWALWHVPFMLSGILYLKAVPPYLLILISLFGISGAGIVISWFWLKTKSIWIVSIAHGALNNWGQYAFKYMQDSETDLKWKQTALFVGVNSSLLFLGLIVLITLKNNYKESINDG